MAAQSGELAGVPAENPKPLSGEVFGALINLSGRRRFTSQRIVLYAMLAAQGEAKNLAIARDALELFRKAHNVLILGDDMFPGVFCPELHEVYYGKAQGDRQIRSFIELAERTLDAIERQEATSRHFLAELMCTPTPMLALLNEITSVYENLAKHHAMHMKMHLRGLITDIEQFARQAKMVALNARIVAARAGPAGQEFAVVARALAQITTEIDDMVIEALRVA